MPVLEPADEVDLPQELGEVAHAVASDDAQGEFEGDGPAVAGGHEDDVDEPLVRAAEGLRPRGVVHLAECGLQVVDQTCFSRAAAIAVGGTYSDDVLIAEARADSVCRSSSTRPPLTVPRLSGSSR